MKVCVYVMPHGLSHLECRLGPVRAVAIHPTRALLVTGGDDYKIKVWGTCLVLDVELYAEEK